MGGIENKIQKQVMMAIDESGQNHATPHVDNAIRVRGQGAANFVTGTDRLDDVFRHRAAANLHRDLGTRMNQAFQLAQTLLHQQQDADHLDAASSGAGRGANEHQDEKKEQHGHADSADVHGVESAGARDALEHGGREFPKSRHAREGAIPLQRSKCEGAQHHEDDREVEGNFGGERNGLPRLHHPLTELAQIKQVKHGDHAQGPGVLLLTNAAVPSGWSAQRAKAP